MIIVYGEQKKGFPAGAEVKVSACNIGDLGSIPGLGRSPGEGNGTPLQYSCLENPMDGGAWWATVHGSQRVGHDWATSFHCHFMVSKYIYMSLFPVFRGIAAVLWTFVWSFSPETLSFLLFQLGFWVLRCLFYDWSYNALAIRSLFNPDFLNADYFEIEILSEGLWFGRLKRLDLAWLCKILWNLHSTCLFEI